MPALEEIKHTNRWAIHPSLFKVGPLLGTVAFTLFSLFVVTGLVVGGILAVVLTLPTAPSDSYQMEVFKNQHLDILIPELHNETELHLTYPYYGSLARNGTILRYSPDKMNQLGHHFSGIINFDYIVPTKNNYTRSMKIYIKNHPPEPKSFTYYTSKNVDLSKNLMQDPSILYDQDYDILYFNTTSKHPLHGKLSVTSDLKFTYQPSQDFVGVDRFEIMVTDLNDTSQWNITIYVSSSQPVSAIYELQIAQSRIATNIDPIARSSGQNLVLVSVTPTLGKATIHDNKFDYVPPRGIIKDKVSYVISDGNTQSTGEIVFNTYNSPPYILKGSIDLHRNTRQGIPINYGDSDPFSNLTLTLKSALGKIELVDEPMMVNSVYDDGSSFQWTNHTWNLFYTPVPNEFYTDIIRIEISDGLDTVTTNLIAKVVNFAPETVSKSVEGGLNQRLVITAPSNTDPDNDPTQITRVDSKSQNGGTVSLVNGKFEYIPPPNFSGEDSFTYDVTDIQLDPSKSKTTTGKITIFVKSQPNNSENTNSSNGSGIPATGGPFHCHHDEFVLPRISGTFILNVLKNDVGKSLRMLITKGSSRIRIRNNRIMFNNSPPFNSFTFSYLVYNGREFCTAQTIIRFQRLSDMEFPPLAQDAQYSCHWRDSFRLLLPSDAECGAPVLGKTTRKDNILEYQPVNTLGIDSFAVTHKHADFDSLGVITMNVFNNPPIAKNYTFVTRLNTIPLKPLVDAIEIDVQDQLLLKIVNATQPSHGVTLIRGDVIYYQRKDTSIMDSYQYWITDGMNYAMGTVAFRFLAQTEIFFKFNRLDASRGVLLSRLTGPVQRNPTFGQLIHQAGWWYRSRQTFIGFDSCMINGYHVIIQIE